MGRYARKRRPKFTNFAYYNRRTQNITPLPENLGLSTSTNAQNNDNKNCGLWWNKLENLSNSNHVETYSPKWNRSCTECGTQLLPSEQKNFCCNAILRHYISPL
ncbi:hypothetical protein F8M41_019897 [Gigaspora margarita]|uniref:Uncharacterized protein n=1 Tax=Gigaspora margarita TaxID=4874 RepID=A0A8H4EKA0_GIGMA|nr:hypothetical protein F8M41_019897 [Gigaspora margarita]